MSENYDLDVLTEEEEQAEAEALEEEQGWGDPTPPVEWDCGEFYSPCSTATIVEDLAAIGVDALTPVSELTFEAERLEQHHLNRLSPNDFIGFVGRSAYNWLRSVKELRPVICGCGTELTTRDTPHITDHAAWSELMESHGSGCPWVNSRGLVAPSTDADHERLDEITQTLTDTDSLAEWQCAALVAHDWMSENMPGYDKTKVIREQ